MLVGLWLFLLDRGPAVQLPGLALFLACAIARPDLALAFVPLTVPLYLIPANLGGLRGGTTFIPLHEAALALAALAALFHASAARLRGFPLRLSPPPLALPIALLLCAGVVGVVIAVPEGRAAALRELRWMLVEPLLFYALLCGGARDDAPSAQRPLHPAVVGLLAAGVWVAGVGLLQAVGVDLVPYFGVQRQGFGASQVETGGVLRVSSVFGHPNNLGLFLGRVWPIAAALALGALPEGARRPRAVALAGVAIICLAGIAVSFSRGAWLGALAAAGVLTLGALWGQRGTGGARRGVTMLPLAAVALALALVLGLALTLRGGVAGGSADARLLLWREALGYLAARPWGLGLDQFYYYHNPEFGRSLIDASLVGTSEQFAAHPHNLLLEMWVAVGPLGALAFAAIIVAALRRGAPSLASGDALALGAVAALAAALTHGLVDRFYFLPDLAITFWLLVAACELTERRVSATIRR